MSRRPINLYITGKLEPGTQEVILYADCSDWRNSPSVPPTAIAHFTDRSNWHVKSSISSISDMNDY